MHSLVEDVKLSTHGRHPTTYPFICLFVLIFICVLISFVIFVFCFVFQGQVCLSSSLGECFESNLFRTVSSISRVRSFHVIQTLGTVCNLSLGVWRHIYTHFVPFLLKKKKMHVHVCLEILVDLRIVI